MQCCRIFWPLIALALLSACDRKPDRPPPIGVAYAGPATLNLHREIDTNSPTVAIVHHGDKLEIVGQRRRSWYKVRTAKGAEGWTSNRELLDSEQMRRLRSLAAGTAGLPSQGVASTFSTVNVHSEPNRQSTSFIQVNEKEKFDVIAHRVVDRGPLPKRELVPARPKSARRAGKEPKKNSVPPPPAPDAPPPPPDWIELSHGWDPLPDPAPEKAPAPHDDWTLIRTRGGQSGWVLTSSIYLQIPDEVAQYAEGHRIMSYFSLGKIADGDLQKDIWLWTTAPALGEDYDFDSYRVFVWSLRHHRYETAYIQRRERGFFPVLARTGEFSVCLERDDGSRVRKRYTMLGNAVRPAGDTPCPKTADPAEAPQNIVTSEAAAPAKPEGFGDRVREKVGALLKKR